MADFFFPPACKSEDIKSVIRNSWKPFRHANTVTPVSVCRFSSCRLGLLNEQSSLMTEKAPVLALLQPVPLCEHWKPPADKNRTHKSEYCSQRVWSKTAKFVSLSRKKLQNLWKLSNYLQKPQGKRDFFAFRKPSLLSISARLSLLFCCTAGKIFFRETACSEWIHATTFYWCCQKEGVWFAGTFLENIQQSRCRRTRPFRSFN